MYKQVRVARVQVVENLQGYDFKIIYCVTQRKREIFRAYIKGFNVILNSQARNKCTQAR